MTELPALDVTYDPETLRERFADEDAVRARLEALRDEIRTAPHEIGELTARGDLVDLLRADGDLEDALHEATAALDRAEIAGNAAQQHMARLRLAQVHQRRGEFADSTVLLVELLAAATRFGPVIEAFTRQAAGLNDYDQRHFADAREQFVRALAIRDELAEPGEPDLPERELSRLSLAAADLRLGGDS